MADVWKAWPLQSIYNELLEYDGNTIPPGTTVVDYVNNNAGFKLELTQNNTGIALTQMMPSGDAIQIKVKLDDGSTETQNAQSYSGNRPPNR